MKRGFDFKALVSALTLIFWIPSTMLSTAPSWWAQRGVLSENAAPDDFAVANQGQLKNLALAAYQEFQARLPGGAGSALTASIDGWCELGLDGVRRPKNNPSTNDFAPVNQGQLKALAKPFYDRLREFAPTYPYPWTGIATAHFAPANLGQLKNVFAFVGAPISVVAQAQSDLSLIEDTTLPIQLVADGSEWEFPVFSVVTQPLHGTLSGTAPDLIYTPALNYSGPDNFTFKATLAGIDSNIAAISISVTPEDDPPWVFAGPSQTVTVSVPAHLSATVTDVDTADEGLSFCWEVRSGPGQVTYADPHSRVTDAAFELPGTYVLELTAFDGQKRRSDSLLVEVNPDAIALPSVALVSPANDSVFEAPATISLQAIASCQEPSSIDSVAFWDGGRFLAAVSESPYQFVWSAVAYGTHNVTAVARDNSGRANTSLPVLIYVGVGGSVIASPGNNGMPDATGASGSGKPGVGAGAQFASIDTDGDGLTDAEEDLIGSDPSSIDTDRDGIPDNIDSAPTFANPATPENLGSHMPDYVRYRNGEIKKIDIDSTKIELRWESNGRYVTEFLVEKRVSTGPWKEFMRVGPGVRSCADQGLLANQNNYYRITAIHKLGPLEARSSAAEKVYEVPILRGISVRTSASDRAKPGHREFEVPNAPVVTVPKYYLTETLEAKLSKHDTYSDGDSDETGSLLRSGTITPRLHLKTASWTYSFASNSSYHTAESTVTHNDSNWQTLHWKIQDRSPDSLIQSAEHDMDSGWSSASSNDSGLDRVSRWSSGAVSQKFASSIAFQPNSPPPFWEGSEFDLSRGTFQYSGSSHLHEYSDGNDFSHTYDATSTPDPVSSLWTGTYTVNGRGGGREYQNTGAIDGPVVSPSSIEPFHFDSPEVRWVLLVQNPQITPTVTSYHEGASGDSHWTTATRTLSAEYPTKEFTRDVINDLPDFPIEPNDHCGYYYPVALWSLSYTESAYAGRDLSASEEGFRIFRSQYELKTSPSVPYDLEWYDVFRPEDNPSTPEDEGFLFKVVRSHRVRMGPDTLSVPPTPVVIDPSSEDRAEDGDGNYFIAVPPRFVDRLDPEERKAQGLILERTTLPSVTAEGQPPAEPKTVYSGSTFVLLSPVLGAKYKFQWEGNGLTLWLLNAYDFTPLRQVKTGDTLTWEDVGGSIVVFTVDPALTGIGALPTVKFTATDAFDTDMGTDTLNLVLPVEMMVDANRDGLIEFGIDTTSAQEPFRFWINEDHDHGEIDDQLTGTPNHSDNIINGIRDLEDVTQVKFKIPQVLIDMAKGGTARLGFKWKDVTHGSPSVRIWSGSPNIDKPEYLKDQNTAFKTLDQNNLLGGSARLVSGTNSVWLRNSLMNDATSDTVNLLMEGVTVGSGKLTLMIKIGLQESEGPSIDLKLLNVRQMYERGKITLDAPAILDPWNNPSPPALTWVWDPWKWQPDIDPNADKKTIVYVHGWRMTYEEYLQWGDTTFKRLWQLGYKGRFYAFRWPTYHGANNGLNPADLYKPGGTTYNASEYRAWLSGPALASFVNGLPNANARYLIAHSMGNVTSGSALRYNMQVTRYAMCNSAMAAMAYDGTLAPDDPGYQTPDIDADADTRQTFGLANKFNTAGPEIVNFSLPNDAALGQWSENNKLFKPQGFAKGTYYFYAQDNPPGTKLEYFNWTPFPRFVTSVAEAMGYVTKSRTRAAGARQDTGGSVVSFVNMGDGGFKFGNEHSAEWVCSIQKTYPFWRRVAEEFNIDLTNR